MKYYLGIDTSNYTTSLCLLSDDGELVGDVRQVLEVAPGEGDCANRSIIPACEESSHAH